MNDDIVEEIRRYREVYAARFNFDISKMVDDLRRREKESGRQYVSFPSKPPREQPTFLVRNGMGIKSYDTFDREL